MDSAPPPSFPFVDSPLCPGCATPHPQFTCPTLPTHPPPLCMRGRGTAWTVRHPPPFHLWTIPSAQVVPPPTPSLRTPPHLHTCYAFAHMPEVQGGQCASPSFRVEGTAPTFHLQAVPPTCPPICVHARVTGGTACPPFHPWQSPLLGLCHPPLCMHAEGWCTPACSSLAQPALVPAPPCSRLT